MASAPIPFDPKLFFARQARDHGHGGRLGMRYVAHGDDWCELALPFSPELIGDPARGVLASGPIIALLDMSTSVGVWIKRGGFLPHATLDLRVDYLRPAIPGRDVVGQFPQVGNGLLSHAVDLHDVTARGHLSVGNVLGQHRHHTRRPDQDVVETLGVTAARHAVQRDPPTRSCAPRRAPARAQAHDPRACGRAARVLHRPTSTPPASKRPSAYPSTISVLDSFPLSPPASAKSLVDSRCTSYLRPVSR